MTVGVSEFGYDVLRWHLSQAVCICQVHAAQTPRYSMQLCTTGYLVLHLQQRLKRMRQLAAGLSVLAVQSSVGLPAGRNNCAEKASSSLLLDKFDSFPNISILSNMLLTSAKTWKVKTCHA